LERKIAAYEEFMAKMAVNIIKVTTKVGLISAVPLPYDVDPQQFRTISAEAMQRAQDLRIEYLVIDMSNLTDVRAAHNIPIFGSIVDGFRMIGIEVIMCGIHPKVAMAAIDAGVNLKHVRIYGQLVDVLREMYRS
jgi:rsbT co-antagonist protein RsbR